MLQLSHPAATMHIRMNEATEAEEQRQWVVAIARHSGTSVSALARKAGLAPSTLNRFINNPSVGHKLSNETLGSISSAAGVPVLEFPGRRTGFSESEAEPFKNDMPGSDAAFDRAVRTLCQEKKGRDPWVLKGWGLDLLGYMPGDVLIVDLNRLTPKAGRVVCAQVYDYARDRAETIMRVFDSNYLLTASSRVTVSKPLMVDGEDVVIKGTVTHSLRRSTDD